MAPLTHLLASWVVAVHTTNNPSDTRLVTLAGLAPDLDGIGIFADWTNDLLHRPETSYYQLYHHWYGHGVAAALLVSIVLAAFARNRWRVFALCLLVFHLHLLCDLAGSRGPDVADNWPIYYFGPFRMIPTLRWSHQWALDSWPNRLITAGLLVWAMGLALRKGRSFVGVFSERFDRVFVSVLQKWRTQFS